MLSNFRAMLNGGRGAFVCGLPYELAIQEGRMFREDIESDMLEHSTLLNSKLIWETANAV